MFLTKAISSSSEESLLSMRLSSCKIKNKKKISTKNKSLLDNIDLQILHSQREVWCNFQVKYFTLCYTYTICQWPNIFLGRKLNLIWIKLVFIKEYEVRVRPYRDMVPYLIIWILFKLIFIQDNDDLSSSRSLSSFFKIMTTCPDQDPSCSHLDHALLVFFIL